MFTFSGALRSVQSLWSAHAFLAFNRVFCARLDCLAVAVYRRCFEFNDIDLRANLGQRDHAIALIFMSAAASIYLSRAVSLAKMILYERNDSACAYDHINRSSPIRELSFSNAPRTDGELFQHQLHHIAIQGNVARN